MSEQTYYEGSEFGNYQYTTLTQVVDDYMSSRTKDSYDFDQPRHLVINHARWGLRELYFDAMQKVRAIELALGSTLAVKLPPDYVDYVRISWVDDYGKLYPMAENKTLSISRQYLQDSNYDLLFDGSGNILQGTPYTQTLGSATNSDGYTDQDITVRTFRPNLDKSERFPNGGYRIDKDAGLIRFDSSVYTKSIVLEYISDGLYFDTNKGEDASSVKVHKYAEQALHDFIYWKLIRRNKNVPFNEKQSAKKDYYNAKRVARRRISQHTADELLQAVKASNVWIKGSK
jgi:hypothetical protein